MSERPKRKRRPPRKPRKPKQFNKNGIPIEGERPPRRRFFPGEKER